MANRSDYDVYCVGSSDEYGLHTWTSSSTIHLVSPLTKESVSINNGGGGNYGGDGTIKTIKNKTVRTTRRGEDCNIC